MKTEIGFVKQTPMHTRDDVKFSIHPTKRIKKKLI